MKPINKRTLTDRVFIRAKKMLEDPKIYAEYQQQKTEKDAKEWILYQSLITLMYSHEERKEMIQRKTKEGELK